MGNPESGRYRISLEIAGKTAMWTRPDSSDSPVSYPLPTYSAAKGIFESVIRIFPRHTGLSPAELAWLSWADVDIEGRTVKVQGKEGWKPKTDEERVIPLNDTASDILTRLYKARKGSWVFSRGEKPVLDIKKALLAAGQAAGIHKRVTANMLRHSFATHALQTGWDIQAVQAILGHKELQTTARYTHALTDSIRRTVGLLEESPDVKEKGLLEEAFN